MSELNEGCGCEGETGTSYMCIGVPLGHVNGVKCENDIAL